ncbi:uncharacterized protein BP5553_01120 [Venustampulla echinocandica]|uniref:DUF7896 domain-containing protein n=1 Tax=Venustampulla echinocandica TaxID=2656787 RepID=A0A370U045_9HELO|nr:uncharacterized protein BP5553_01120 [Venustampulla echinocandica]RDL41141.1 hypothetical protein BP5553_01120 [Venustampulla echinocandica]
MPMDLRLNTTLDADQRLQQLLARKAEIDAQNAHIQAEIAALFPPSAPSYQLPRSPINKHRHRRGVNVSRSMSSSGATMARQHSDLSGAPPPRSRTLSQRSAPAPSMARTNSRGASSASSGNLGFTQSAAMPPPFPAESQESLAMETWMKDQSMNTYAFSHQTSGPLRSISQRGHTLEQVEELDVGEDPSEFISRTVGTPTHAFNEYSTSSPALLNSSHLSAGSFYGATPTTPTTDTLTIATTLQSSMSQQSHEPVLDSFQMMKVNSNASYFTDINSPDHHMFDHVNASFTTFQTPRSSSEEQKHLLAGLGGASHDSQFSHSFPSADALVSPSFGAKMEKSQSSESTSSASSSRSKQRLLATVAAARPLKPRGGDDENDMSRTSSSRATNRLESEDGSQDKVAISKPTYQRPRHDRVFCKQCESHPDGFRGEHELRRHQDREHKPMVKKWVCIEPTTSGHPKPVVPLSKCKACCQQKKYGAYYNAAAHLRRTHFKPKAKGRSKTAKGSGGEKRAGKGGGDLPVMAELKFWMKEVEEQATEYPRTASQEDVDDSDDEPLQNDFDDQVLISEQTSGGNNFDESFLTHTSPIPSIYAATGNDAFVSNDLASEQGSFANSSMYGHDSFSHFSPSFSNDAMAFFDSSLPQAFDDQASAGLDFASVNFSFQ